MKKIRHSDPTPEMASFLVFFLLPFTKIMLLDESTLIIRVQTIINPKLEINFYLRWYI